MKPETIRPLETAARNRDLARALISHGPGMGLHTPPFEWVAVVAFYSAVHYVNALLWEWRSIKPATHTERNWYVDNHPPPAAFSLDYRVLNSHGRNARYAPGYRLQQPQAIALTNVHLAQVETTVCSALGFSPL